MRCGVAGVGAVGAPGAGRAAHGRRAHARCAVACSCLCLLAPGTFHQLRVHGLPCRGLLGRGCGTDFPHRSIAVQRRLQAILHGESQGLAVSAYVHGRWRRVWCCGIHESSQSHKRNHLRSRHRSWVQIHDEVFPRLASGQLPENSNALPRLLGVTNLYFLKALPGWPNVLSTGKRTVLQRSVSDGGLQVTGKLSAAVPGGCRPDVCRLDRRRRC